MHDRTARDGGQAGLPSWRGDESERALPSARAPGEEAAAEQRHSCWSRSTVDDAGVAPAAAAGSAGPAEEERAHARKMVGVRSEESLAIFFNIGTATRMPLFDGRRFLQRQQDWPDQQQKKNRGRGYEKDEAHEQEDGNAEAAPDEQEEEERILFEGGERKRVGGGGEIGIGCVPDSSCSSSRSSGSSSKRRREEGK